MEKKKDEKRSERSKINSESSESVTGNISVGGKRSVAIGGAIKGATVVTGDSTYFGGDISTGGGDFVGRDKVDYGPPAEHIERMFAETYALIETSSKLDDVEKSDLTSEVRDIQEEVGKGDFADETLLSRRLRYVARMAPEIGKVVLETLADPSAEFSPAVQRVARETQKLLF